MGSFYEYRVGKVVARTTALKDHEALSGHCKLNRSAPGSRILNAMQDGGSDGSQHAEEACPSTDQWNVFGDSVGPTGPTVTLPIEAITRLPVGKPHSFTSTSPNH